MGQQTQVPDLSAALAVLEKRNAVMLAELRRLLWEIEHGQGVDSVLDVDRIRAAIAQGEGE